jgi:hypothetical protein
LAHWQACEAAAIEEESVSKARQRSVELASDRAPRAPFKALLLGANQRTAPQAVRVPSHSAGGGGVADRPTRPPPLPTVPKRVSLEELMKQDPRPRLTALSLDDLLRPPPDPSPMRPPAQSGISLRREALSSRRVCPTFFSEVAVACPGCTLTGPHEPVGARADGLPRYRCPDCESTFVLNVEPDRLEVSCEAEDLSARARWR